MARVLLGVTGSVAAVRTPSLAGELLAARHELRVIATEPSLHFFDPDDPRLAGWLLRDRDEWPERPYQRGDPVPHIDLRNWADLLVVAPLDANTLAKLALGLADNFLTCVFRAWDHARPVILAPAMNTRMWDSPATLRHLRLLLEDHGDGGHPARFTLEEAPELFARHAPRIVLVPPQAKRLACGDFGIGAMAEVTAIAEAVRVSISAVEDHGA